MKVEISKVLKREFKSKGLKLKEVSNETGISISSLADWRDGRIPSAKSLPKLQKLADYLDLSLSELMFDCNEKRPEAKTLQSTTFSDGGRTYRVLIERIE